MKNIRLVSNIVLEDEGTFTLENIRVLVLDLAEETKLEGSKRVNQNYSNVSTLFTAIQAITVDIATSTLVD